MVKIFLGGYIMKKVIFIFILLVGFVSNSIFAQPVSFRTHLRNQIQTWGSCRTVAITRTGGIAIYGDNGWYISNVPEDLANEIKNLNKNGNFIRDVILTDQGRWLIIYDDNGLFWDGIPSDDSLITKLREYNELRETILSVTFNDFGDWVIITQNYFSASDSDILDWLIEGNEEYGQVWNVHLTDDGIISVYEEGYKTLGSVPESLFDSLDSTSIHFYVVKFFGSYWFYADVDGNYQHNIR